MKSSTLEIETFRHNVEKLRILLDDTKRVLKDLEADKVFEEGI